VEQPVIARVGFSRRKAVKVKKGLQLAGALIVLALVLGVIGLVLRAVRWLLIVAAVILVIGALVGAIGNKSDSTG
jgi:ABC-type multidrug transport system permease subunit